MEVNPADWALVSAAAPAHPPDSAAAQSRDQPSPPANAAERLLATAAVKKGDAAVLVVHPTSYSSKSSWNAPLDDADANYRAGLFMRGMASAFADAGEVWAPRYRQATLGAFLATDRVTAGKAIDAAYRDVEQAFDSFQLGRASCRERGCQSG